MLDLQAVIELMQEVDSENPIDWGTLNIDEDDAARLIASSLVEHYETSIRPLEETERDYVIVSAMGKLALENFALNMKLLQTRE
jgi:hypothetical protein